MLVYGASILIFLFVSFSLFFRSHAPLWLKAAGTLLVFLISQKYVIYKWLGGAFFAPHLPRWFLISMEALYGGLLILFFLLLIWNIYLAGNWILAKTGMPIPMRLPKGAIKCGLAIISLCLGIFGVYEALKVPEPREIPVAIKDLPPGLDGFRVVQLTDLHIGGLLNRQWLEKVVAKANALDPDLIALTGDYVDGHVSALAEELRTLAVLKAKYGVLGVTGNHEYYWNAAEWQKVLGDLGIKILENEHSILDVQGNPLVVAGIPDLVAERFGMAKPDIAGALAGAPEAVRVLLSHQPKNILNYEGRLDLQLSGHTHGGMLFFLQPLVARFNAGFVHGLYDMGDKNLYVHPGTGLWTGFASRVGVPSEITLLVLRTK